MQGGGGGGNEALKGACKTAFGAQEWHSPCGLLQTQISAEIQPGVSADLTMINVNNHAAGSMICVLSLRYYAVSIFSWPGDRARCGLVDCIETEKGGGGTG